MKVCRGRIHRPSPADDKVAESVVAAVELNTDKSSADAVGSKQDAGSVQLLASEAEARGV